MADGKPSAQTDGTKRKALDISTKRAILNELAQGAKNCELVKKYGVSKSTISTILKNKDKIISADANSTDRKRLRRATYADASFADVGADADPEASEEDHSGGDLWQCVVDSDMGGRDICWDDFVMADDDADTAEPCTDEGIVNEVRGKSDSEESDDDDDETLEPAPTSVPVAIGYIDSLRQLVYAKGLGEEHAAALNKLETTLIASALSKQTGESKLKNYGSWSSLAQSAANSPGQALKTAQVKDSFQQFKKQAREKMDKQRQLFEAQEQRRQRELAEKERLRQEQEKQRALPPRLAPSTSVTADEEEGRRVAAAAAPPASPTENAMAGQIDMNRQSDIMATFEEML
ncbi:hypothetical protein HPB52_022144 [Rhipicephalus sanguineus]|uniref:HTH psq-type domain-containing protein n=1 Tax=Rhipicephalus sanguineus TaxID=34632 RepID=A0A9D4YQR1_RHISA|nr:hypothetical protein HPB52_022144 [Rhipicephalus sanguineus]